MRAKKDFSGIDSSQYYSLLYQHANKKMVAQTELFKNLQVELNGFGKYLVAALIPNVSRQLDSL